MDRRRKGLNTFEANNMVMRILSMVNRVVELDPLDFLNYSADWFNRLHPIADDEMYKKMIDALVENVNWFPNGNFSAELAEKRLTDCEFEITPQVKLWLAFTENHENQIKTPICYETGF